MQAAAEWLQFEGYLDSFILNTKGFISGFHESRLDTETRGFLPRTAARRVDGLKAKISLKIRPGSVRPKYMLSCMNISSVQCPWSNYTILEMKLGDYLSKCRQYWWPYWL
jgi:hypothetical protein